MPEDEPVGQCLVQRSFGPESLWTKRSGEARRGRRSSCFASVDDYPRKFCWGTAARRTRVGGTDTTRGPRGGRAAGRPVPSARDRAVVGDATVGDEGRRSQRRDRQHGQRHRPGTQRMRNRPAEDAARIFEEELDSQPMSASVRKALIYRLPTSNLWTAFGVKQPGCYCRQEPGGEEARAAPREARVFACAVEESTAAHGFLARSIYDLVRGRRLGVFAASRGHNRGPRPGQGAKNQSLARAGVEAGTAEVAVDGAGLAAIAGRRALARPRSLASHARQCLTLVQCLLAGSCRRATRARSRRSARPDRIASRTGRTTASLRSRRRSPVGLGTRRNS